MNLEQLRGFVEVARLGHFTRASEYLHLAQPSLSRQISTLERELGAELFHRARGHIALTAAGEALLPALSGCSPKRRPSATRWASSPGSDADACASALPDPVHQPRRRGHQRVPCGPPRCRPAPGRERVTASRRSARGRRRRHRADHRVDGPTPSGFSLTRMPLLTEELVVVSAASQPPVAITPRSASSTSPRFH